MRCLRSVRRIRNLGDNMSKVDNEKKPQANRKLKKNKYCIVANILQCHDCIFITFHENKRFLLTVLTLTSCAFVSNDKNIEFSHGFEVISVCCDQNSREACLNGIVAHSESNFSPFIAFDLISAQCA